MCTAIFLLLGFVFRFYQFTGGICRPSLFNSIAQTVDGIGGHKLAYQNTGAWVTANLIINHRQDREDRRNNMYEEEHKKELNEID